MSSDSLRRARSGGSATSVTSLLDIPVGDTLFIVAFVLFLVQSFLDTTMIAYILPDAFFDFLKLGSVALVALKILIADVPTNTGRLLFSIVLIPLCLFGWFVSGYGSVLFFIVLVVGAAGVDFERIARTYFWMTCFLIVFTLLLCLLGIIENNVIPREGRVAYSCGFYYTTEFSAHVLYAMLALLYCRRDRISTGLLCSLALVSIVVYLITDSRLLLFLSLGVIAVFALYRLASDKGHSPRVPCLFKLSFVLLALAAIGLMITYDGTGLSGLASSLGTRFSYAHQGYLQYGLTAFGQQVDMLGWGGGKVLWAEDYFYVDCSYAKIALRYGYVILTILVALCSVPLFRLKKEAFLIAVILCSAAAASFINEHMIDICYNVFSLMAFARCVEYQPIRLRGKRRIENEANTDFGGALA